MSWKLSGDMHPLEYVFLYRPEIRYYKRFKCQVIEYVSTYIHRDMCYCGTYRVLAVKWNFIKGEIRIF